MADVPIAVLISGRGSNLRRILEMEPEMSYRVMVVIADREAAGLEWAERQGIPTRVVPWSDFADRRTFSSAICDEADEFDCEYIVLAGFMRILAPIAIERYRDRILNVHPSLLPAFPGARAVEEALAAGVDETGVTVHIVEEAVDAGPVLAQRTVPVLAGDDPESLHVRIQEQEHELYPRVIDELCTGRLQPRGVA